MTDDTRKQIMATALDALNAIHKIAEDARAEIAAPGDSAAGRRRAVID